MEKNTNIHVKKNVKFYQTFVCSDSSTKALAEYNTNYEIFTPNEVKEIPYEQHTYIIHNLVKEKYKNDAFVEEILKII